MDAGHRGVAKISRDESNLRLALPGRVPAPAPQRAGGHSLCRCAANSGCWRPRS